MRRLRIVDAVCEPGAGVNEDRWGAAWDAAWVIDGATGLSAQRRRPGPSDAAWLAAAIDAALRDVTAHAADLPSALQNLSARLIEQAPAPPGEAALQPFERPSAGLAIVRLADGALTLASVGDCRCLLRKTDGSVERFGESPIEKLDEISLSEMQAHMRGGKSPQEARAAIIGTLRRHRSLMNTPDGYGVVDLSASWPPFAQHLTPPPGAIRHILMMTDGFYRLTDCCAAYSDDTLFSAALNTGLAALYRRLRGLEDSDPGLTRYGRLKHKDDATAVLLEVAPQS